MMAGGGSVLGKENRSPGPNHTGKGCFHYGRVPVRTRCRRDGPGERPGSGCSAANRGQQSDTDIEQPPPPALDADITVTVTPSPIATPVRGAVGHGPCLARRVPARAPPSAKGPSPLSTAGTQTTLPAPLRTQENTSMGLRVPKKNGTPGSSSAGLTLRVSATKHMTPLRWRPAVTLQPDTADDNELTPSWGKVVVQLFKGNEGQQDTEVTVALPSSTPGPSKAQRAAQLLGQLQQMVQDRPAAITVLTELWGLMAEWGVDPKPQDPLDTHSLSS
ncbi:uncharacterized protein LOC107325795 isoform X4 [Coturnix japonica]|uniref:uncharacterized protein LOC107325795 isoform X4 n=1 Tax=Coturnix japonica TaxID=93934 RepID=UPI0007776DB4|nr:uncharacterized protein LOC107325795 isoform X4 [Coturnix japonica]